MLFTVTANNGIGAVWETVVYLLASSGLQEMFSVGTSRCVWNSVKVAGDL